MWTHGSLPSATFLRGKGAFILSPNPSQLKSFGSISFHNYSLEHLLCAGHRDTEMNPPGPALVTPGGERDS